MVVKESAVEIGLLGTQVEKSYFSAKTKPLLKKFIFLLLVMAVFATVTAVFIYEKANITTRKTREAVNDRMYIINYRHCHSVQIGFPFTALLRLTENNVKITAKLGRDLLLDKQFSNNDGLIDEIKNMNTVTLDYTYVIKFDKQITELDYNNMLQEWYSSDDESNETPPHPRNTPVHDSSEEAAPIVRNPPRQTPVGDSSEETAPIVRNQAQLPLGNTDSDEEPLPAAQRPHPSSDEDVPMSDISSNSRVEDSCSGDASASSGDNFVIPGCSFTQKKALIRRFVRDTTEKRMRQLAKVFKCPFCNRIVNEPATHHYSWQHRNCGMRIRNIDEAHEHEKIALAWKHSVSKKAVISAQEIRNLKRDTSAAFAARILDGGIFFGANVDAVNVPEFRDIQLHMKML